MSQDIDALQKEVHQLRMENQKLKRTAQDLKESEDFSRAVFTASQTGMLIILKDTRQIMDANPAAAEILGCEVEDLLGHLTNDCIPSVDGDSCLISQNAEQGDELNVPGEMIHRDGHTIQVMRSITHIKSSTQGLILFGFMDITALKEAEDKLMASNEQLSQALVELQEHKNRVVQSEKLASIGQLAAGVAHEINNPVGYVTSNLGTISEYAVTMKELLEVYADLDQLPVEESVDRTQLQKRVNNIREEEDLDFILDDLGSVLKESMEGVHRVAEIVQNLKSFAREDSNEKSSHNVNEGIEAVTKVIWNELKYRCEVEHHLNPIPEVEGHGGQINQVVMNMMVNASQAMPEEGGLLKVGTSLVNNEVEIKISDNGSGMTEDTLNKVFDPFFTTKDVGVGTGLGLSIGHGIIEDHGGRIEVESEVGRGTTFRIYLPTVTAPEQDSIAELEPEEELIG